ncbi:glycosyltransferase [Alphaproteobacteria bacterium]|nr:glycosyltransferase [Alphaproteobacteria bacterium]
MNASISKTFAKSKTDDLLTVDIIIYVKNAVKTINLALDSVANNSNPRCSCIVVDGLSTDGTSEILLRRKNEISQLLIEPDNGAAEAANKGLALGNGDIVCFLMGDDLLKKGAIQKISQAFKDNPTAQIISSGVEVEKINKEGSRELTLLRMGNENKLSLENALKTPYTGAHYFRRRLLENLGGFNHDFKYSHDRDLLMRALQIGAPISVINEPLYCYLSHSKSLTLFLNPQVALEFTKEHITLADRWINLSSNQIFNKKIASWQAQQIKEWAFLELRAGGILRAAPRLINSIIHRPKSIWFILDELVKYLRKKLLLK